MPIHKKKNLNKKWLRCLLSSFLTASADTKEHKAHLHKISIPFFAEKYRRERDNRRKYEAFE